MRVAAHEPAHEPAPAPVAVAALEPPLPMVVPVAEPSLPVVAAPVAVKTEPPPRAMPPVRPIPELPPVTLTLPPETGLELVETRFKPAPEPEPELPAGPRRVRPPKVQIADEPLQMVETQKEAPPPAV